LFTSDETFGQSCPLCPNLVRKKTTNESITRYGHRLKPGWAAYHFGHC